MPLPQFQETPSPRNRIGAIVSVVFGVVIAISGIVYLDSANWSSFLSGLMPANPLIEALIRWGSGLIITVLGGGVIWSGARSLAKRP